jgi:hypothetical protein
MEIPKNLFFMFGNLPNMSLSATLSKSIEVSLVDFIDLILLFPGSDGENMIGALLHNLFE